MNIGKWVLRNLFLGFIREEQRVRKRREDPQVADSSSALHPNLHRDTAPSHIDLDGNFPGRASSDNSVRSSSRASIGTAVITSPCAAPAIIPLLPTATKPSNPLPSMIPLPTPNTNQAPHSTALPLLNDRTPMPIRTHGLDIPLPQTGRDVDYFSPRSQRPSTSGVTGTEGEFPSWGGPSSPTTAGPESPMSATPTSAGGLMGRLKNFGKASSRRPTIDAPPGSPRPSSALKDISTVSEVSSTLTCE